MYGSDGIDMWVVYFFLISFLNRHPTVEVAIISRISWASSQDVSTPTTIKSFASMLIFVTHLLLKFLYLPISIKKE